MGASLPGARTSFATIGSPASSVAVTSSGDRAASFAFSSREAAASMRAYAEAPKRSTCSSCSCEGVLPVTARISEASSARMMPSLSVDHTVPSLRRNDAPALSSPPKPTAPDSRPGTKYLKPTGTSISSRPMAVTTRSMSAEDTRVLPTAASLLQPGRCVNRYSMATARKWFGFIRPSGVTIPWRSESASLPVAMS